MVKASTGLIDVFQYVDELLSPGDAVRSLGREAVTPWPRSSRSWRRKADCERDGQSVRDPDPRVLRPADDIVSLEAPFELRNRTQQLTHASREPDDRRRIRLAAGLRRQPRDPLGVEGRRRRAIL